MNALNKRRLSIAVATALSASLSSGMVLGQEDDATAES